MRFLKSAAILGGSQVAGIAITFLSRVVLGRLLGTDLYGQFGIALNTITVASRSLSGGLAPAIQYSASRPEADRQRVMGTAVALGLMATLLATWTLFLLKPWLLSTVFADHAESARAFHQMVNWFPLVIFTMFLAVVLVPFGKIREYGIVQAGASLPFLLSALAFAAAGMGSLSVAVWAQVVAWLVMLGVVGWGLRGSWRGLAYDPAVAKEMLAFAWRAWPNTILFIGVARLATLVGAGFMTTVEASWFIAAMNLVEGILAPHSAMGQLILSRAADGTKTGLETTLRVLRLSLPAFGVLFVVAALLGPLMLWLFGPGFAGGYPVLMSLLATGATHALVRVYSNFFAGRGEPGRITGPLFLEVILLVGGVLLMGPHFGLWGVVWASVASAIVSWLACIHQMVKLTGAAPKEQIAVSRADFEVLRSALRRKPASPPASPD